ncbi:protoporphyrinogen oxidase [Rhineura floridana]|uniref:protoporphyrinogen oxidase n=1 Tax=Rhineura floridana TaxID=261503 RepID=UPI002AC84744|nr:protoporphyrinogen oxidase [Rhineura floridana]XP_061462164.1 protoporphyrinogen oxidase [Rhineura floridana]XP_061462165.1 protoporphyrinogen oxidase [Rhineura floridana]XP_061462166.1 protoporphyrinogen oxidase [Rhineura floridana]
MQRTVAVLGGGVSGLAACYYLARSSQAPKVILLESSSRLGGWIHSTCTEDGAVFEHGPRGIRPAGAVGKNTLLMVSELGLEGDVLPVPGNHPASKNRFLYVRGALHKLPSSIGGFVRTVPPFTRPLAWSMLKELMTPRGSKTDESIHAFAMRRFGQELADILVDSLCRGVFAGDCRTLSMRSCFPAVFQAERMHRSVIVGMALGGEKSPPLDSPLIYRACEEGWSQWSLRAGMQSLPKALEDFVRRRGVEIHCGAPVRRLERAASGSWRIALEDGVVEADHVISALPAKALSRLLPGWAEPLSRELLAIQAVSVGVVNLQYKNVALPVTGFGHLVPAFEDSSLLGIVYDSVAFPEQDGSSGPSTRLTVMLGGAWFTSGLGDPDTVSHAVLLSRAQAAVKEHLGVSAEPCRTIVKVQKACIPQYTLGHWKHIESAAAYLEQQKLPLSLVGASYKGVSVNDCISGSRTAVSKLLGHGS